MSRRMVIAEDADLVRSTIETSGPYLTYKCGCWIYTGDLDAPHEKPCSDHAEPER